MKLSTKRFNYGLIAAVVVICIAIAGVGYFGYSTFTKQSTKLKELKAEEQAKENQKESLAKAKQDILKYSELNDTTKAIVPKDKDQAKTIREIDKIAADSGIRISNFSFSSSTLGQAAAPTKSSSDDSGNSDSGSKKSASTTSAISQAKPVEGIPGVLYLEISLQSTDDPVPYDRFLDFLEKLESNRRTSHVSAISVSPQGDGSNVTFSLTLNAYIKPE